MQLFYDALISRRWAPDWDMVKIGGITHFGLCALWLALWIFEGNFLRKENWVSVGWLFIMAIWMLFGGVVSKMAYAMSSFFQSKHTFISY